MACSYKGIKNEKTLVILDKSTYYKALAREIIEGENSLAHLIKINDKKTLVCRSYVGGVNKIQKAITIISRCKAIIKEESHEPVCVAVEEKEEEEPFPSDELFLPLPLHVAMKIFAQLPVPSIAQLRLVCKSWNSLLSSASFLSNLEQEYQVISDNGNCGELWFVLAASTATATTLSHDLSAFSYPLWKPFRLPLHTSPKLGDLLARVASSQSLVPSVKNMLVASAGGLMCAVVKGAPLGSTQQRGAYAELAYDMVVFNCLTGELKTLPRPARLANKLISSCKISMRADAATNAYGIIVCDAKYREMEIYDSQAGSWQAGAGIRSCREADHSCNVAALTNADMSIEDVLKSDVIRYRKEELAVYNVQNDCWRKAEVVLPRIAATELLRSTVVKCGGAIYLVACLMKQAVRMEGYGVWELREEEERAGGFKWVERGRTPAAVVAEFGRTKFESPSFYDCRFVGGVKSEWVCMTGVHYTIGSQARAEYWPPLLFNVRRQQWQLLPKRSCLCLFPFEPRFTAPV